MAVFHLRRSSDNRFYFVAYAKWGPRLIQSGPYPTRDAAQRAVEACRSVAADEAHYHRHDPGPDKHYFDMTDAGKAYLATSDTFSAVHRRDETISYCRERLPKAGFTDDTLTPAPAG